MYFDVPYDPKVYRVQTTKCRVYDKPARWTRLWQEPLANAKASAQWLWDGYAKARDPGVLVEDPAEPVTPFHYAASVWQKV